MNDKIKDFQSLILATGRKVKSCLFMSRFQLQFTVYKGFNNHEYFGFQ